MTKEHITPSAIRSDLHSVINEKKNDALIYRLGISVPFAGIALIFSNLPPIQWLAIFPGLIIAYNFIRLFIKLVYIHRLKSKLNGALLLDDFVVSVEKFSHFTTEGVWWPFVLLGNLHHFSPYKEVQVLYFSSGKSWRLPIKKPYYAWSDLYSTGNIDNSTFSGDEFYFIRLAKDLDIAYAYTRSRFEM